MGRSLMGNVGLLLVGVALFVNGLVSAILLLNGLWPTSAVAGAAALAILVLATVLSVTLSRRSALRGEGVAPVAQVEAPVGGGVPQPA